MYSIVLTVHVILAAVLVGLVLLQQGKGADVGAIMGSGGANSLFGVSGASNLLVRLTTGVAISFMITSLLLVRFSAIGSAGGMHGGSVDPLRGSAMEGVEVPSAPEASSQAAAPLPVTESKEPATSAGSEVPAVVPPVPKAPEQK